MYENNLLLVYFTRGVCGLQDVGKEKQSVSREKAPEQPRPNAWELKEEQR